MNIQEHSPKATVSIASRSSGPQEVTPALRYALIAERAYIKGCQRGFINGSTGEDWRLATEEIDHEFRTRRT